MSERAAWAKMRDAVRSAPAAQETAPAAHAAQRTPVQRPVAAAADADTVSPRPQGDQRKGNYDARALDRKGVRHGRQHDCAVGEIRHIGGTLCGTAGHAAPPHGRHPGLVSDNATGAAPEQALPEEHAED